MSIFKKVSVFIAVLASLSFCVFAFEGEGTLGSPFTVSSLDDFKELAEISLTNSLDGVYFVQTADITVNDSSAVTGTGNEISVVSGSNITNITIAADEDFPFMGSYNGNGYSVSGVANSAANGYSGLFAHIKDAEIKNLNVTGSIIDGDLVSGGIAGVADGSSKITGCSFSGTATVPSVNQLSCSIGGIVGKLKGASAVINCTADIYLNTATTPFAAYFGGIAGENYGTISECTANGKMIAVSNNYAVYLGGITGSNQGSVYGSTNNISLTGTIADNTALLYIGGIAGINNGGSVERAVNTASVYCTGYSTTPGYVGGITGYNSNGSVEISKNSGEIAGEVNYAGGVSGVNIAESGESTVSDCLNTGNVTVSSGIIGGLVGGNIASTLDTNKSVVTSSMNLTAPANGNAAVGAVETDSVGVSDISNLVVKDSTDESALTMTASELKTTAGISALKSEAWVYPQNGFLPDLAIAKNLAKSEIITMTLDKAANKAYATLYNTDDSTSAVAIVTFIKGNRFVSAKIVPITLETEYTVFTVESSLISSSDTVNVMVLDSLSGLIPAAELATFR